MMYLEAINGCWLTQIDDVDFKDRVFLKKLRLEMPSQAVLWKEILDSEKIEMEKQESMINLDNIDYTLIKKVDKMNHQLPYRINDAHLSNNEALEMQKYFPTWEQSWGIDAPADYKFTYQDVLVEVVTPHVISQELDPSAQPMTLNLVDGEDAPPMYYRVVEAEVESFGHDDPNGQDGKDGNALSNTQTKEDEINKQNNNI